MRQATAKVTNTSLLSLITIQIRSYGLLRGTGRKFYEQLTDEQKATIKVVTGDGARWITDCVNEFTPDCIRCVDPFHVVEWAMEALDKLRAERWHKAVDKVKALSNGKAEADLNHWLWWASHSRIPVFHDLYEKIKLIIRKAYGFRNINNMIDMVYLVCSDIQVPLPNRKLKQLRPA